MPTLAWTDTLELKQAQMDDTHREFVVLLGHLEEALAADSTQIASRLDEFIAHTEAHFEQEDRWMRTIGFQDENCHTRQHVHVLQVLHETRKRLAENGQLDVLTVLVPELVNWFPQHAHSMDAGLAEVMALTGYCTATDTMANPPQAAPQAEEVLGR